MNSQFPRKEYYYTKDFFDSSSIGPFVEHCFQYLNYGRTIPVAITNDYRGNDLYFTFSNELTRKFVESPNDLKKPYESALKYGFRGYSAGGKNGIFLLRKQDVNLTKAFDELITKNKFDLLNDLDLLDFLDIDAISQNIENLKKVKIVWHETSGERIIGLYNTKNNRIFFLCFAHY